MRKQIAIIGIFALVMLVGSIVAYAMWYQTLLINNYVNTGKLDFAFKYGTVSTTDPVNTPDQMVNYTLIPQKEIIPVPENKDVGTTYVKLIDTDGDGDYDALNVTIVNGYPWYYTHIGFTVVNSGTIPLKIWRIRFYNGTGTSTYYSVYSEQNANGTMIDLNGDGKPDILMWWGDNFGLQLHPGQTADISFDITILQDMPQNANLTFIIYYDAIQWNEYDSNVPSGR
ncbi:MAG: hypothetical protein GXO43_07210 [Crenarchaeota archaeon]|nr:hypothetical protein [Thermoproteota archaeon]